MTAMRHEPFLAPTPAFTPVPRGLLQRKCACGGHTPAGGECESCKQNGFTLQRKSGGVQGEQAVPPVVHDELRSPGVAMDAGTRAFFETRFGRDLSSIRLHTDARAASSANAVNALAFTVGRDVVFGAGNYTPHTAAGKQLLAHELAHAIQQGIRPHPAGGALRVSEPSELWERQADNAARDVLQARSVSALGSAPGQIARAPAPAKKCPSRHTIPGDVYKASGEEWRKSGQAGETVTEHGGRIVTDSAGKRVIRTGSGGGGSISLPAEEAGDVTLGTFHTHPYSKSEGSKLGVSFSGGDIENFIAGGQGSCKYVHAGTCIFVLNTLDTAARDGCKAVDVKQRWDDKFASAGGNFQLKVDAAVRTAIAGCGLCYYGTCRPDAKSPIPRSANLA